MRPAAGGGALEGLKKAFSAHPPPKGGVGYPMPTQKYHIETEGPGFRAALQREIDKIMGGPDGPYYHRSVETISGSRPVLDASLAPNIKMDDSVRAYFKLMNDSIAAAKNLPHFDKDGNIIQDPTPSDE